MPNTPFSGRSQAQTAPANVLAAVTPDDAADLPHGTSRALYVGTGGTVAVMDTVGNVVTLNTLDAQYHPIRVRRVLATDTTAQGIIALY